MDPWAINRSISIKGILYKYPSGVKCKQTLPAICTSNVIRKIVYDIIERQDILTSLPTSIPQIFKKHFWEFLVLECLVSVCINFSLPSTELSLIRTILFFKNNKKNFSGLLYSIFCTLIKPKWSGHLSEQWKRERVWTSESGSIFGVQKLHSAIPSLRRYWSRIYYWDTDKNRTSPEPITSYSQSNG